MALHKLNQQPGGGSVASGVNEPSMPSSSTDMTVVLPNDSVGSSPPLNETHVVGASQSNSSAGDSSSGGE